METERSFQTRIDELKDEAVEQMLEGQSSTKIAQQLSDTLNEALDVIHEMAIMLDNRHCCLSEMEEY